MPTAALATVGVMVWTACAICRMWSGVVPQHPPTSLAPALMNRRAYVAM